MDLNKFDAKQVESVSALLTSYGIEPSQETLNALIETAIESYPNDPNGLEKAAKVMLEFFAEENRANQTHEFSWSRFKRWIVLVLRVKSVGIFPGKNA